MKCPFCGCDDTQVKDSRNADDNTAIRRRRECPECGSRFTTFERVQLRELTVIKKNGEKTIRCANDRLIRSGLRRLSTQSSGGWKLPARMRFRRGLLANM